MFVQCPVRHQLGEQAILYEDTKFFWACLSCVGKQKKLPLCLRGSRLLCFLRQTGRRASQKALKRREPRRTRRAQRRAFLFLSGLRVLRGSRLLGFLRHPRRQESTLITKTTMVHYKSLRLLVYAWSALLACSSPPELRWR